MAINIKVLDLYFSGEMQLPGISTPDAVETIGSAAQLARYQADFIHKWGNLSLTKKPPQWPYLAHVFTLRYWSRYRRNRRSYTNYKVETLSKWGYTS